jgi:hypothetical protein
MATHSLAAIESANTVLPTRTHHLQASVRRKLSTGMRREGTHVVPELDSAEESDTCQPGCMGRASERAGGQGADAQHAIQPECHTCPIAQLNTQRNIRGRTDDRPANTWSTQRQCESIARKCGYCVYLAQSAWWCADVLMRAREGATVGHVWHVTFMPCQLSSAQRHSHTHITSHYIASCE